MIHSLNYIIYTIGSIGLVGVFYYFTTDNKLIQTDISNDIIEVIDNTIYLPNKITKSIGIQCEFDISNLEQSGDIEIILTNSNSNYRWFRWKN